jgi:hypothetical protein
MGYFNLKKQSGNTKKVNIKEVDDVQVFITAYLN